MDICKGQPLKFCCQPYPGCNTHHSAPRKLLTQEQEKWRREASGSGENGPSRKTWLEGQADPGFSISSAASCLRKDEQAKTSTPPQRRAHAPQSQGPQPSQPIPHCIPETSPQISSLKPQCSWSQLIASSPKSQGKLRHMGAPRVGHLLTSCPLPVPSWSS